jgi:hypothetical protein
MHGSYQWKECNEFGDAIIPKSNVKTVAHKPTCRKASIEATTNNRFCQIVHLNLRGQCAGNSSSRQTPWPSKRRASAILLACAALVRS